AGGANDVSFAVLLQVAGAATCVVVPQRRGDVGEGQVESNQLRRVRLDVILLLKATDRVDPGNARYRLELRANDPVLPGPQVGGALQLGLEPLSFGREIGSVALPAGTAVGDGRARVAVLVVDRPHVDFAQTSRDGPHAGLGSGR